MAKEFLIPFELISGYDDNILFTAWSSSSILSSATDCKFKPLSSPPEKQLKISNILTQYYMLV